MILSLLLVASTVPQPLVRIGTCPLGYYGSGTYCVPSTPKQPGPLPLQRYNMCPLGYYTTGNYCTPTSR